MDNKTTQPKKRTQLSIIIRDPVEKLNRSGVNSIKYENNGGAAHADRLFTAGRDAIIRCYANLMPSSTAAPASSNGGSGSGDTVDKYYQFSMSHHTDWINDLVVVEQTKTVFSASSDSTVKVWNSAKGSLLNTLRLHRDYVKCLSYARDKELLASAGFDKNIFLWDVCTGVALNPSSAALNISDNKYSIYSLAMNSQATLLASGSPENCVRLWDPRTGAKSMKLKGHSHNIRCLLLNRDATQCLSASSDHTIRLWSLGEQRCITTVQVHSEGVWTLCADDAFNKVYSSGKDCRVYATDLRNPDESVLVCEETAPVLSLDFGFHQESLWVANASSTVRNWSLLPPTASIDCTVVSGSDRAAATAAAAAAATTTATSSASKALPHTNRSPHLSTAAAAAAPTTTKTSAASASPLNKSSSSSLSSSLLGQSALQAAPTLQLAGAASIKHYHVLNDKRYIVTKDSDEHVCVWDVLQARKSESLGRESYESAIRLRQRFISIPNWFTVDLKLGVLTVNLDESEWQSAWINFKDMDSNHVRQTQHIDLADAKVNYGCIFLESLFKSCLFTNPQKTQTCMTVIVSQSATAAGASGSSASATATAGVNNSGEASAAAAGASVAADDTTIGTETTLNAGSSSSSTTTKNREELAVGGDELGQAGLLRFNIPEHIPIVFSEVAGRSLYRVEVRDLSRESEQLPLSNVMPAWVIDALFCKTVPKFNRLIFILNPYNQSQAKIVTKERLSSIDLLQVKKLKEHVYQKILELDKTSGSGAASTANDAPGTNSHQQDAVSSNSSHTNDASSTSDLSSNVNRTIELICSDQILSDNEMNLRTIKHLIWKGTGDLTIFFRLKS